MYNLSCADVYCAANYTIAQIMFARFCRIPGPDNTVAMLSVLRILIRLAGTRDTSDIIGVICEVNKHRHVESASVRSDAAATKPVVRFARNAA